jgi:hypothetical protein
VREATACLARARHLLRSARNLFGYTSERAEFPLGIVE